MFIIGFLNNSIAQCNIAITAEVVNCSDANNTFNALITVSGTGVGNSFVLGGNGVTFGSFSYSSSPIEIGPFTNTGAIYNFAAVDNTTLTCFGETQILPFDNCPVECEIEIVDVEFLVCDGLDRYANVYIEHNANVSQNFTLTINQVSQGSFNYGQDFYTLGPLNGFCMEGIGINALDNFDSSCSDFYFQPGPWCCPDECAINDIIVNTYCENDEIAGIIVDFNYNGASNESFEILMDSLAVDTVSVSEFPDTIFYNFIGVVPDSITQGFGVSHVAKPNCGFYDNYTITCESTPPCGFSNVVLSPITCVGEDTYSLGIDFQVESATSIFFDVYSAGTYLGAYEYANLPIVIDNFPGRDAEFDIITICDNGNNSCCETVEFMGLDCEEPCNIFNYFVEAHECDVQGMFEVYIQFEQTNESENGFIVRGNGIIYDTFQYNDNGWYVFGPLVGDCVTDYEFIVIDLDAPDCNAADGIGVICCEIEEDCELSNLSFDEIGCEGTEIGFFYSFEYTGTTNDFYDLYVQDDLLGFYEFSKDAQYLTIPVNEDGVYEITICENDNPDCCITNEFEGPECDGIDCDIREFFIEAQDCNDDGLFEVDLEFVVDNPTSSGFTVFGDGNNYGSFEYGEIFYTVGPFEGDCSSVYEFVLVDNDNSDCTSNFLFLGPICCEMVECNITDLDVTPIECIDNGIYNISIDFNVEGATNDFFDVIVDNEVIGFYAIEDLPIVLDYNASGNNNDVLSVCINDNLDCCALAEFEALDCFINVGDCGIDGVFAEAYECDEDGFFLVDVAFDVVDGSDAGFEIRGNGTSYGEYEYGETFYTIGPLDGDCETIYEFIVIDLEDETCFGEYVFEEPICCDSDECEISNLEAEIISCDSLEGIFFVSISFDIENNASQFFTVTGNGEEYGSFGQGLDSYTLGPLAADGTTEYEFIVTDILNEDCTAFIDFGTVECMTTATEDIFESQINIYFRAGNLSIDNPKNHEISDLKIFNLDGKYLFGKQNEISQSNLQVPFHSTANGIFVLVLKIEDQYHSFKFLIIE